MTTRLRPIDANGHGYEDDEDQPELLRLVKSIDERLGHSPDHATASSGSGLCKVVAELKQESDYQARRRLEKDQRHERWKSRIQTAYSLVGALAVLSATGWGMFKLLIALSH